MSLLDAVTAALDCKSEARERTSRIWPPAARRARADYDAAKARLTHAVDQLQRMWPANLAIPIPRDTKEEPPVMSFDHFRRNGTAVDVTLTDAADPVWMPIVTSRGRVPVTVIAGGPETGKTALLDHIEAAAFASGLPVTRIRPLDAFVLIEGNLQAANNLIDQRMSGAARTPHLVSVDDVAHLLDDLECMKLLHRICRLGPALGVGALLSAETVGGRYRTEMTVPAHDQAIALGPGGRHSGFGPLSLYSSAMSGEPAHYLDAGGGPVVAFTPPAVQHT